MSDPTAIAITASFLAALVVFAVGAVMRTLLAGRREVLQPEPDGSSESLDSGGVLESRNALELYKPPEEVVTPAPPELPAGKVPTWFYHPLDLMGAGLIFLLFFGLATASTMAAAEQAQVTISAEALVVSIGAQFLFAGVAVVFVAPRIRPSQWLGLRWPAWPWVLLIAPATVLLMWALFAGLQLGGYMRWMERLGVEPVQETVKLLQTTSDPLVLGLMALAAVVVAPLCEEIVFRGYLYPVAKRFAGPWVATVSSALVFAAAHGNLAALFPLFIFGMVLVFLYERTGSIWAPVAVHFLFNGATVAIQVAVRVFDIPIDGT